jgi:hypothetical protein
MMAKKIWGACQGPKEHKNLRGVKIRAKGCEIMTKNQAKVLADMLSNLGPVERKTMLDGLSNTDRKQVEAYLKNMKLRKG